MERCSAHEYRLITLTFTTFFRSRRIKETQQITIKANLGKPRDAKPRVLASSEKPWNDSPKDPKTAGPPKPSALSPRIVAR